MLEFITSNPFLLLAFGVVVVFVLMFILVKPDKKKKKKVEKALPLKEEKKEDKPKDEKPEVDVSQKTEEKDESLDAQKSEGEKSEQESEVKQTKKVKKTKEKPEITQVYKRTSVKEESETENKEVADDAKSDLAKRAQFVKTTGKVSKLVGFSDIVEEELKAVEQLTEMPVQDFREDCEACEKKIKHFDHSRRLSKMIQEDSFDDMLEAHISEKYLNINVDKHLGISEDFSEKLFDRALKTLSNSASKVLVENEDDEESVPVARIKNDKEFMKSWLEERKREELAKMMVSTDLVRVDEVSDEFVERVSKDVDLSPKNIVVVDALLKRKGMRGKKK